VYLGVLKECAQKKLNVSADDLQSDESSSEVITVYSADGTTAHTLKASPEPSNTTSAKTKDKCENQPKLLTKQQSYRFRELLRQSIICDCFELADFELDPAVVQLISEELQYITSVLIASYTIKTPDPVKFDPKKSYVALLHGCSGKLDETLWHELIEAKSREIRDRVNQWFNRDRELEEDNWSLLDSFQQLPAEKSSRRNSVEYLGQRINLACIIPQQEEESMDDSPISDIEDCD